MENRRDLPWRETKDPYLIWIAEIILQQTRVNQAGLIGTEGYLPVNIQEIKKYPVPRLIEMFFEEFFLD